MSNLTKRYQEILKDIKEKISNEKDLEYINKKIAEISLLHMEVIENMTEIMKNKINMIEQNQELINAKLSKIDKMQNDIDTKINKIENSVLGIENDMYDEGFDLEIICPYCNTVFTADVQSKTDLKCPECQNIIELDWNLDETAGCGGCSGHCSSCSSKCGGDFFDEFENDLDDGNENDDEL